MHEAVLAGQHLDEAAEVLDGNNLAPVELADLDLGGDALDGVLGHLQALDGHGVNQHASVVLDVDLATGLLDDALDVLATRADQLANLRRVDRDGDDPRRVRAHLVAFLGQAFGHVGEDRGAGCLGLGNGLLHDGLRNAV